MPLPGMILLSKIGYPVEATLTDHAYNPADQTSYSFASQSFGVAADNRHVVVCVGGLAGAGARSVSSMTIGGVAATKVVEIALNAVACAIYIANVPTGTTGTVSVTFNAPMVRAAIAVYRVVFIGSAVAHDTATNVGDPASVNIDVPAGGVGIGFSINANITSVIWSGLTEDIDVDPAENFTYTSAHGEFGAEQVSRAVSVDSVSAGVSNHLVVASWGRNG